MSQRNAILKTLRRKAEADTIGHPKRLYETLRNGTIIAVNSTRARYLELKRAFESFR